MTTLLNLNVNKILTAHGELNTDKHFSLGADKFKLDGEEDGAGTLVTSLASTFNGTVLLGSDAKLTATGDVDVKSIFRVQDGGSAVKLAITPESDTENAFDLNLNATFQKTLKVDGETTLTKLTAGECDVESVTASAAIQAQTLSSTGIANFGGLATAKAGMAVEGAPLTANAGMTVTTGTFKAAGNTELREVVNYASDDDPTNLKLILDHSGIGAAGYGLICHMKSHFTKTLEAESMKVTGVSDLDVINAKSLSTTGGITVASKVTSETLDVNGEAQVGGSLTVNGDIIVNGSMTTVESKEVNIGDNHIYLNADNIVLGESDAGIVTNCKAIASYTAAYYDSGPGVRAPGSLRLTKVSGTDVIPANGDFVQMSGFTDAYAYLNGIHEVYIASGDLGLDIRFRYEDLDKSVIRFVNNNNVTHTTTEAIPHEALTGVSVTFVQLSHLMFCAKHGTVKFAYGGKASKFDPDTSYTDLIKGDVQHTYEEVTGGGEDVDIVANVTQVTDAFTGTKGLVLPSNAPKGSEYKVINSHSSPITVKGDMYNGEGSADVYSSMIFTRGKDKWYNV